MSVPAEETVAAESDEQATEALADGSDDTGSATQAPDESEAADQGAEAATGEDSSSDEDEFEEDELLSKEEYDKVKDDPKKLRKALNRAFTQKTQQLAPYSRLVKSILEDPQGAVRQMARELGIPLAEAAKAVDAAAGNGKGTTPAPSDELMTILEDSLGEDLAGKLLPVFTKLVDTVVEERTAPLAKFREQQLAESALRESTAVVNGFKGAHPDYPKYEKRMLQLAKEIQPGEGMTETKWLQHLYSLAKSEDVSGDRTKEVVERVNKAAAAAEKPSGGTPPSQVSKRPPNLTGKALIRAAVRAASQGEIWED